MFTDERRQRIWDGIRRHDCRAFQRFLQPHLFTEAAGRAGVSIGNSALSLVTLVWLGIAAAGHAGRSFSDILVLTLKLLEDAGQQDLLSRKSRCNRRRPHRSKHDPRREDRTSVTEEAFAKARQRMPLSFWTALIALLADRFVDEHPTMVRWKRFRLLSLDGTSIDLPSWSRLAEHYGTAKNGSSAGKPQARMVMLGLPLVRLPWRYELCPLQQGERTIAARLLEDVRRNDLVLMDQGFWSYGLFHQIAEKGAFFGIRVHPQPRPKNLRRLGPRDRLVRWNKPSGPRWRGEQWPPSQKLRIIDYQVKGFRPSAVATNVLDPQVISRKDWIHMATKAEPGRRLDQGLYHRRWEIETTFHELKNVQGMQRTLRSRTPAGIAYEVAGHVLLYLLVRWLMAEAAVEEHVTEGRRIEPLKLSFKGALQELLDMRPLLVTAPPPTVARRLLPRLLKRIASHLVPFRPGRHFPRPNDTKIKNTGRGSKRKIPHKLITTSP